MDDLVLVFDTEATGLPVWNEPSDSEKQPHIVQLAAELCTPDGEVIERYCEVVNIGVPIPPEVTAIHGIDDARAAQGVAPKDMLASFFALVDRASLVVAYNTSFDKRMVRIQAARHLGQKWDCPKPTDDSMWIVCKAFGCKKPKLGEAMQMVFGEDLPGAHDAMVDTTAARRIFFEMKRRGYVADNPRIVEGGNNPPPDEIEVKPEPSTFEAIQSEILKLYDQAKGLLDGEPIDNELAAIEVGTLREEIRKAAKRAEDLRVAEKKPHDDAAAAVQARYNPLIQKGKGKTELALAACNEALAPYLKKKDDDLRAEAERKRQEANRVAQAAVEAARAAAQTGDLTAKESAEDLIAQAKGALKETKAAEREKSQVRGTGGRAIGMTTIYEPELVDPAAAIEHYRKVQPAALKEFMIEQAKKDIRAGPKPPAAIPGFRIASRQVPR